MFAHLFLLKATPPLNPPQQVTISPDKVLTISGERKYEKEEGKQGEGVWRVERSFGSFMRRWARARRRLAALPAGPVLAAAAVAAAVAGWTRLA